MSMGKIKYIFQRISLFYWRFVASPEKYARHIGVKIGKHCFISTREWSNEPYLITIGDNVQVTRCVSIHTHGGGNSIRKEHPDFDVFGKVVIEDWAYIGAYSHIMPGVTIGEGALVAAGSIVTKSVAPHTVVGGNPARVICTTEEYYEKNKKYNVGTKKMSTEEKKRYLLSLPEEMYIKK
ncbi:MAG: acyltransferase [Prevotella sp.]|nr:acyltransferase [Prevotella sp.]